MTRTEPNRWAVWLVVIAWAGLVLVLSALGVFAMDPKKPPLPLLAAVVVPPVLFLVAHALSSKVRAVALSLDLRLLTAMQAWRVIGGMFLVLMWLGLLPGTFAWPAGVGDLIVGAYAPFVAVAVARQTPGWRRQVVLLNVLGLLDFVGAIGGGVMSGSSPIGIFRGDVTADIMQQLPLSIIPTFGVPFWIVLHIISLMKVRGKE
ncbi:MAG: hypothetical protein L0Y44_05535 [Phycisphaerales bacterium]|nr:hypothetical protein [Phycisphaerales bacterium]MCI0677226.1 hypothetical protein [Phycisphaerales bacterium]